jgi:hypothetical protein
MGEKLKEILRVNFNCGSNNCSKRLQRDAIYMGL